MVFVLVVKISLTAGGHRSPSALPAVAGPSEEEEKLPGSQDVLPRGQGRAGPGPLAPSEASSLGSLVPALDRRPGAGRWEGGDPKDDK